MTQFVGAGGSFGPNAWLVDDMYDRFLADPGSVSESWREFFADYRPAPVPAPPPPPPAQAKAAAPATAAPAPAGANEVVSDEATPLRGAALADRGQHGGQPGRADGHQRPHGPGPRCSRSTGSSSTTSWRGRRGQGQLHPPHRLRRGPRPQRRAGPQLGLRGRRRREGQARRRPSQARRARARRRRGEERRQPDPARALHQGRRHAGLPLLRPGLRGPHPQGSSDQQDRARRLRRDDRVADQPRDARHRAVGAAPDAGPGRHRRRRGARLPRRVRGRRPPRGGPARPRQGGHAHLDLRPPDHPGGRVRAVPRPRRRVPLGRCRRLLRRDLRVARRAVRAGALADGRQRRRRHGGRASTCTWSSRSTCRRSSTCTGCAAT